MNQKAMIFMGMGFELLGLVLGSAYLGSKIDEFMGWRGEGFLILFFLTFIGWSVHFVFLVKRFLKEEREREIHD